MNKELGSDLVCAKYAPFLGQRVLLGAAAAKDWRGFLMVDGSDEAVRVMEQRPRLGPVRVDPVKQLV